MRDYKIHNAKSMLQKLDTNIKQKFKVELSAIGVTMFDEEDTLKSLLDRLDKYFVMSKLSSRKKIFYGTACFDFYESQNKKDALISMFKKKSEVTLCNFFNGIPIKEEANVLKMDDGIAQVKVESPKIAFYAKEEFTFLQHDQIPNIIKANIIKTDPVRSLIILNNLEFLDTSPVDRSGIRVMPDKDIFSSLSHAKKRIIDAMLINISESSVALKAKITDIEKLLEKTFLNKEMELEFQLPTEKSFLTKVIVKAFIFSIMNDMIVVNIQPNPAMRAKIRQYIGLRQNALLVDLKQQFKRS
ncbi:MAG: hypothetical protein PHW07_02775 [Sulfurospirillaceae bacterium]|nr:hypothetical protein [Sulfurospirillaceae bacterium]